VSLPDAEPLAIQLYRLFTTRRARTSSALEPLSLSFSQYVCLQLLDAAPHQSNAELARAAGVTPQAMNGVVRRMQSAGLIDRPDDASSGRARPAHLTGSGRKTLMRADAAVRQAEQQTLSGLTDSQRAGLHIALRALAAQVEEGQHPSRREVQSIATSLMALRAASHRDEEGHYDDRDSDHVASLRRGFYTRRHMPVGRNRSGRDLIRGA
jgi:DNA-binding MarR family transcriptional regulator